MNALTKKPLILGAILLAGVGCAYFFIDSNKEPSQAGPEKRAAAEHRDTAASQDLAVEESLAEIRDLTARGEAVDFQSLQSALQSLVRRDPKAAAAFASSQPDGAIREIALHRVAQAWAGRNPEAAAQWANAIRNQEERGALLNGIFCEVAQGDPAKAVQMAETYDMLSFLPAMSGNLVQQWAARDYDAALRWTEGQASGTTRDQMFQRLALVRFEVSPEEAASVVSERIAAGGVQEEAAITIVSRWAAKDPESAKEWANSFAAGAFRERALNEIELVMNSKTPGS